MEDLRLNAVLVDLDNTLLATGEYLLYWLQMTYNIGEGLCYKDITDLRIENCIEGCTFDMIKKTFETPAFWGHISLLPGAHAFILGLQSIAKEVHIVTDRFWYDEIRGDTKECIDFADLKHTHIAFVDSKDKAEYVKNHNIELAFEDRVDIARAISEHCPVGLIAQPYNDVVFADTFGYPIMRLSNDNGEPNLKLACEFSDFIYSQHLNRLKRANSKPEPAFDTILDEAQFLVLGARQGQYSHPFDNFSKIASLVNGYLGDQLNEDLEPEDVAMIMALVKIARIKTDVNLGREVRRDSLVDLAGYALTCEMVGDLKYDVPEN